MYSIFSVEWIHIFKMIVCVCVHCGVCVCALWYVCVVHVHCGVCGVCVLHCGVGMGVHEQRLERIMGALGYHSLLHPLKTVSPRELGCQPISPEILSWSPPQHWSYSFLRDSRGSELTSSRLCSKYSFCLSRLISQPWVRLSPVLLLFLLLR